jgi:hypothetical protein
LKQLGLIDIPAAKAILGCQSSDNLPFSSSNPSFEAQYLIMAADNSIAEETKQTVIQRCRAWGGK